MCLTGSLGGELAFGMPLRKDVCHDYDLDVELMDDPWVRKQAGNSEEKSNPEWRQITRGNTQKNGLKTYPSC